MGLNETFENVKNNFLLPRMFIDPFSSKTEVYFDVHKLLIESSVDALGNENKVLEFSYRTLSPIRIQDQNDNISAILMDELNLVKASSIEGKDTNNDKIGEDADNLAGISEETTTTEQENIQSFFDIAQVKEVCNSNQLQSIARGLLKNASIRLVYDFTHQPALVASIIRERHYKETADSNLQISFEYTDGFGKVAMKKIQAESGKIISPDGLIIDTANNFRWIGTGRTVLNNKGNPIKQYESYFSGSPAYENDSAWVEQGVSPTLFYDAAGRNVKTEFPNGTFSKVIFDTWKQYHFDTNDTVKDSDWYKKCLALPDRNPEKKAAIKSELHYETPNCIILDNLGRPILEIAHNRFIGDKGDIKDEYYYTYSKMDIEGNNLSVTDARGNVVMQYRYDMAGHLAAQNSMDAGRRWMLNNVLGKPVKIWDERRQEFSFQYDELHRPTTKRVKGGDGVTPLDNVYERIIYGENQNNDKKNNLKGKVFVLYDTAGKLISDRYDFKGNLLRSTRIFAKDYKNIPDWKINNPDDLLENSKYTFTTTIEFDALNRPVNQVNPDGSKLTPSFNSAGLLEKVELLKGNQSILFVKNIDYDAKRQRTKIVYGNDIATDYTYDSETFRLIETLSGKSTGEVLQDLKYTYDPIGNISEIEDSAIPTVFFNNKMIQGKSEYTYDARYQLVEAAGREQNYNSPNFDISDNWNDEAFKFAPNNGSKMEMRDYKQRFQYDPVGNIEQIRHNADNDGSWTRDYIYETKNNRLKTTTIGNNTFKYPHHAQHGFITNMPHLQMMAWNFKEELQATSQQRRTDGGSPETTYYVYDSNGQRARKITEHTADAGFIPGIKDERIYVGGFEVYRRDGLERETIHIMDDKNRIAMIDTETSPRKYMPGRTKPTQTIRYQMSNHLESVNLELNETGQVITYEEYHPFGTTAYQAKDASISSVAKRYRYTGMERDEETGLNYHSARYYIPWLGRWLNSDPIGIKGGVNFYSYNDNRAIIYSDPTGTQGQLNVKSDTKVVEQTILEENIKGVNFIRIPMSASPYVVARDSTETLTKAAIELDKKDSTDFVINTNFLLGGPKQYSYFGHPKEVDGLKFRGYVISNGKIESHSESAQDYYFFGIDKNNNWRFGQGDPPKESKIGFGGAIPLIIGGLKFGNEFKPNRDLVSDILFNNINKKSFQSEQLFSPGLESLQKEKSKATGLTVMGIDKFAGYLYLVVKPNGESSLDITQIRDILLNKGVKDAIVWDGSTSSTLIRDSTIIVTPSPKKDNTMMFGVGFRIHNTERNRN